MAHKFNKHYYQIKYNEYINRMSHADVYNVPSMYPIDEYMLSVALSMIKFQPKLVIGGSLSLSMWGYNIKRKIHDLDFSLSESLDENELTQLISFHDFIPCKHYYGITAPGKIENQDDYNQEIQSYIKLMKNNEDGMLTLKKIIQSNDTEFHINIFTKKSDYYQFHFPSGIYKVTSMSDVIIAKVGYINGYDNKHLDDSINILEQEKMFSIFRKKQKELNQINHINSIINEQ